MFNHNRIFWPVVLITVGVLMLLNNLGLLPQEAWRYWPVLLVVIGLVGLSETATKKTKKRK